MSLSPRTRLGPYEILSPLGAGGMCEVYRGRDKTDPRFRAILAKFGLPQAPAKATEKPQP